MKLQDMKLQDKIVLYLGIPIPEPFSQSRDSGLEISNPGIPAGLWDPGGMISEAVIIGPYC